MPTRELAEFRGQTEQTFERTLRVLGTSGLYWFGAAAVLFLGYVLHLGLLPAKRRSSTAATTRSGKVTFNDLAPIVYDKCAPCHRSGQATPFTLLSYRELFKRAKQIDEVVQSGYMPPWLPEPGYGDFLHSRRLTGSEKAVFHEWVAQGCLEGDRSSAPAPPTFPDGWTLGKPDLVVRLDRPYRLEAEGPDVYRNFVLPAPIDRDRFVRAIEVAPGNPRILHHAFVKVDPTSASRRLDAQDETPGFPGMTAPAEMPDGQLLAWQPGKVAAPGPEGLAWRLARGSDLVLQAHLNRTGKLEVFQPSIAFYFTDQPPARTCYKLALLSLALDIPAGANNYVARDSFVLPADLEILAVLPHAHYLAKEMQGYAILPDGSKKWLLRIPHWDFRWQGDYRYATPVSLPRGTTLHLEFSFDNSTNNFRNPHQPPERVVYGPQSTDEMCELWFQVLPSSAGDLDRLRHADNDHRHRLFVESAQHRLEVNPLDVKAHNELGVLLWDEGRRADGWQHLERATQLDPNFVDAHLNKGALLRLANKLPEAKAELETTIRLDPQNARAFGHLGFVYASMGDAQAARRSFLRSLSLDPNDAIVQSGLRELEEWMRKHS